MSPGYTPLNPTVSFPRSVQVQKQNDHFHTVWSNWTNTCDQTLAASFQGQFRSLTMESTGTLKQTTMCSAPIQTVISLGSLQVPITVTAATITKPRTDRHLCTFQWTKKSYEQQKMPFPFGTSHELFSPSRSRYTCNSVQNQMHWVSNTKWNISTTLSRNHLASTVTIT